VAIQPFAIRSESGQFFTNPLYSSQAIPLAQTIWHFFPSSVNFDLIFCTTVVFPTPALPNMQTLWQNLKYSVAPMFIFVCHVTLSLLPSNE
jgi:hypothetical protein